MQHVQETNLAWSLIEAAKSELDSRERNHIYVSVGAGESFIAIRILLKLIAVKQIPLPSTLVQMCAAWLQAYVLHEDHDRLQLILYDLVVADTAPGRRAIVRSLVCARSTAALAIARTGPQHGCGVTRTG